MSQPPPDELPDGEDPSSASAGDINTELESFRQQWKAEVQAKTAAPGDVRGKRKGTPAGPLSSSTAAAAAVSEVPRATQLPQRVVGRRSSIARTLPPAPQTPMKLFSSGKKPLGADFEDDYIQPRSFDDTPGVGKTATGADESAKDEEALASQAKEPVTALEYYEKAVEKEAIGSLGDSLRFYRKAFRARNPASIDSMDHAVDKKYKNKHYPATATGGAAPPAAGESSTAVSVKRQVSAKPSASPETPSSAAPVGKPPAINDLIASFAGLAIEAAPPPIEGMEQEPCPLASLPDEIIMQILQDVAVVDVGDFVRLAQVCKKLAFLVAIEDRIWRRVCLGSEFGFANMHRTWKKTVEWDSVEDYLGGVQHDPGRDAEAAEAAETTEALHSPAVYPSWQRMFRQRPRIRFNGVYISTVNYIRSGQASVNLVTWNSPVHIVTYFRYLRFYRDGTVISLLTTAEPLDVIHHLTKDLVALHQDGAMAHLPSVVVKSAARGRWRMSGVADVEAAAAAGGEGADPHNGGPHLPITDAKTARIFGARTDSGPAAQAAAAAAAAAATTTLGNTNGTSPASAFSSLAAAIETEGDLVVETEGVGKYYYRMELSFRTAGKGARNNKLMWRGFYSYNRLTDDWGEFGLKNDKPFFFSRVKSYGVGE